METAADQRLRRIMLAVLLAVLALPVAAFAALWIWTEATREPPPAMFADVPLDFRDDGPGTARMMTTFPAGTPETVLVRRLRDEGFEVDSAARTARYEWTHGYCAHEVHAEWAAKDGRVTSSLARYMNTCP